MQLVDPTTGIRGMQVMVPMRDGVKLNTFIYFPKQGGPRYPVILQRTPYGIGHRNDLDQTDPSEGWLPDPSKPMWGSLLRGWRAIAQRGYVAVQQDCRGRCASEGIDRVYADDADDGHDTIDWISKQDWCNGKIGISGSSAAATTALAAASRNHPALKCFFAQVGGSSIYDDVVYEGGSIQLERLWLWLAGNVAGLSRTHRAHVERRSEIDDNEFERLIKDARVQTMHLEAAKGDEPPFVGSPNWMHLPLKGYPAFSILQPFLDEILSHPVPDSFRAAHDYRASIRVPGFHVTSWYDIFQTSVIAAFQHIQSRCGNQRLWIGPNAHYFIYETQFWPRDPYFEWFDHWLKGARTAIVDELAVHFSPRAWVEPADTYKADDWRHSPNWPPPSTKQHRLHLHGDGTLSMSPLASSMTRTFRYDPRKPIPTRGGRNMLIEAGPRDQRTIRELPDYGLIYMGMRQSRPLTLAGPVSVRLNVSSDCPDTDFVAKLVEVDGEGRAILLMDGVVRAMYRDKGSQPSRLIPGRPVGLTISLGDIYHTIPAGHHLELDITSSNFPRRARNTNSGNPMLAADTERDIRVAMNSVHHGTETPCYVDLTILP